jgi:flagellar biosynthesis GTPase FlhF
MIIQSNTRGASILLTIGCSLVLLGGGPVFADKKGEQEKAEKDLDKAEKGQKKGGGQQAPGGQNPFENPLEKILDLMKGVEEKLFEADTGDFTQSEQKKIVDAMRFEDKTKKALDKLIDKIENSQQQSSSSSSSSSQQKKDQKKNKSQKNQRNQQQKSKQQQQKEKEQEAKRQAQKQKQQQQDKKQQSQQDKKKSEAQKKKEQEQKRKAEQEKKMAEQRKRNGRPPNDKSGDLNEEMGAAGRWGSLPAKLFQDAQNVRNRATPSRYRRLIERYRERISGKKSN